MHELDVILQRLGSAGRSLGSARAQRELLRELRWGPEAASAPVEGGEVPPPQPSHHLDATDDGGGGAAAEAAAAARRREALAEAHADAARYAVADQRALEAEYEAIQDEIAALRVELGIP